MTEPTMERRRRGAGFWIGVAIGAAVVVVLVVAFAGSFGNDPRQPENVPLEGVSLAEMELPELPYLDGTGTVALDDLEGSTLVVNFFASYCIPCRAEHAELTAVFDMYRDRGVQFVGIVYQDTTEAATAFLDELGWGEGYIYLQDPGSRAIVEFGVFGVPETYVVDASGVIREKFYGAVDRDDLVPVLDAILDGA